MKNSNDSYKIILLGDNAVGKTAISHSLPGTYTGNYIINYDMISFIEFIPIGKEKEIKLLFWDREQIKSISSSYLPRILEEASCVILVYSVDSRESFENLQLWYERAKDCIAQKMLVGNKIDLERTVNKAEVKKFAQERNMQYLEVSAKDKTNMDKLLEFILELILE